MNFAPATSGSQYDVQNFISVCANFLSAARQWITEILLWRLAAKLQLWTTKIIKQVGENTFTTEEALRQDQNFYFSSVEFNMHRSRHFLQFTLLTWIFCIDVIFFCHFSVIDIVICYIFTFKFILYIGSHHSTNNLEFGMLRTINWWSIYYNITKHENTKTIRFLVYFNVNIYNWFIKEIYNQDDLVSVRKQKIQSLLLTIW